MGKEVGKEVLGEDAGVALDVVVEDEARGDGGLVGTSSAKLVPGHGSAGGGGRHGVVCVAVVCSVVCRRAGSWQRRARQQSRAGIVMQAPVSRPAAWLWPGQAEDGGVAGWVVKTAQGTRQRRVLCNRGKLLK